MRRKFEDMLWAFKIRWYKSKQARQEQAVARASFESMGSTAVAQERADAIVLEQLLGPNQFRGTLQQKIEWAHVWENIQPGVVLGGKITAGGLLFIGLLWLISKL